MAQNRESCYLLFVSRDVNTIDRSKISKILRAADQRSSDGSCSYGEASWSAETGAGKIRPAYRIDSRRHVLRCSLLYDRQGFCANPRDLPRGLAVSTSGEQSGGSMRNAGGIYDGLWVSPLLTRFFALSIVAIQTRSQTIFDTRLLYKNEGKRRGNFRRICFLPILEKRKIIFKRYLSSIFGFLIRMKINAEEILEELQKNLNYEET